MARRTCIIEEWVAEAKARGMLAGARGLLLRQLRYRFGDLPPAVVERVENASRKWCEKKAIQLLDARSLAELDL